MRAIATLKITLFADGAVGVDGPLHDKVLCHGLMGVAALQINQFKPDEKQLVVVPPNALTKELSPNG